MTDCDLIIVGGGPAGLAHAFWRLRAQPQLRVHVVEAAAEAGGEPVIELELTMPTGTSWSVVRVPVLSKRTASILPAVGTRKGSVHMTPAFMSAMRAVLTARAVCIGKWRGTTEVTMITHLRAHTSVVVARRALAH